MLGLRDELEFLTGKRVLVVGDVMLDEFVWTEIRRISPEAPVPVAEAKHKSYSPGGAANVAANIRALGGTPVLVGVVGRDPEETKLRECLSALDIRELLLVPDEARQTTLKTRVMAANHHVLRIDRETQSWIGPHVVERLMSIALDHVGKVNAIALSDYAKGVLTPSLCMELISEARRTGTPVIVDPKGEDLSKYAGASIVTPNEREVELTTGIRVGETQTVRIAAEKILAVTGARCVVIKRGRKGISLYHADGTEHHVEPTAVEVADVTGAGDTVTAVLALGLAAGLSDVRSAQLAAVAAGIVVRKPGTATAHYEELRHALSFEGRWLSRNAKIRTLQELAREVEGLRDRGAQLVLTNGCFDLLHSGHVYSLETAKAQGDVLIVAVNSDSSVRVLKGAGRPVMGEVERATVLAALQCVDYVVIFPDRTAERVISALSPDVYVKGAEYTDRHFPEADVVRSYGGRVHFVPRMKGHSTSDLVKRLSTSRRSDSVEQS